MLMWILRDGQRVRTKSGNDVNKIFSLVVQLSIIRTVWLQLLYLIWCLRYEILVFLYGNIDQEIYMIQPKSFIEENKEHLVCRLMNSLYNLKQVPR